MKAASSIALNLAEGSERGSDVDQRRFYRMAMGSIRECQAVLDLISRGRENQATKIADELGAAVFKLCKAYDAKLGPQQEQGTEN